MQAIARLREALAELAKVKIKAGTANMAVAKQEIRDTITELEAPRAVLVTKTGPTVKVYIDGVETPATFEEVDVDPPVEPPPPPAKTLFLETFDTSPAPSNYADTAVWNNDGEVLPVSGGVGHADVTKIRLWTHASFPADVAVSAKVTPLSWRSGGEASWAGFKFYLRREADDTTSAFYTVEPLIEDGSIVIQKKVVGNVPGGNYVPESGKPGGTYFELARGKAPLALGGAHEFKATVIGSTISLYRDGVLLLSAKDDQNAGQRGPLNAGHAGFRSDSLRYDVDDFTVKAT